MRYNAVVLGFALLTALVITSAKAAVLFTLNSGENLIRFSNVELPVMSSFPCDHHIYRADKQYSQLASAIYHSGNTVFGVFNACFLSPLNEATRADGSVIAVFLASSAPPTKVAFLREGDTLSPLEAGTYALQNKPPLTIDATHRVIEPTLP